ADDGDVLVGDEGEDGAGQFGRGPGCDDDAVAGAAVAGQHLERNREQAFAQALVVQGDVAVDVVVQVLRAAQADGAGPDEAGDAHAALWQDGDHRREDGADQQRHADPPPGSHHQPLEQVAAGVAVLEGVVEVEQDQRGAGAFASLAGDRDLLAGGRGLLFAHGWNILSRAAPGSRSRMKLSPIRKAFTSAARRRATSSRVAMPLSVTSRRSGGTASRSWIVVSSETLKSRRLRLLMPTRSQSACSARSSSSMSWTSTSTSMPSSWARLDISTSGPSSRPATISRMQSAPITRAS